MFTPNNDQDKFRIYLGYPHLYDSETQHELLITPRVFVQLYNAPVPTPDLIIEGEQVVHDLINNGRDQMLKRNGLTWRFDPTRWKSIPVSLRKGMPAPSEQRSVKDDLSAYDIRIHTLERIVADQARELRTLREGRS